jgi:hypothetical protein
MFGELNNSRHNHSAPEPQRRISKGKKYCFSAVFLRERDIVLTNENWRTAIDLDDTPYREVISTIREDLLLVEKTKKEFTATSELGQIKVLETLEWKLNNFKQILPRLDPRRGLINWGGAVLKSLFGMATAKDIQIARIT